MASFTAKLLKMSRNFSSHVRHIEIPVPWGGIVAGKWWGPTNQRPILSLHGWQDNSGSFDRLLPLLNPDNSFLCIDLPGHGWSSRIPKGMRYHYEDYVVLVKYLQGYFQWPKVALLGHSMGASVGYIFTVAYPEDVDFLVCLEGSKPYDIDKMKELRERITKFLEYDSYADDKEPPSYPMDEIKRRLSLAFDNSISFEHGGHIADRAVRPSKIHQNQFYFINDPRLKVPSWSFYSQEETLRWAPRIKCPVYVAYGKESLQLEPRQRALDVIEVIKKNSSDCRLHTVKGTHHLHLNNPEVLQDSLNDFLNKYYVRDRWESEKVKFVNAKL